MVLLLPQKFAKLCSKLENHHHHDHTNPHHDHHHQIEAFKSEVSKFIGQLALDLKPGSETMSLSWIEKCFGLLPFTNMAFSKLVVDIDYPISLWGVDSIEGYLSYTLCLLHLFNSISSALSQFGHARLSLSHGLSLLENSPSLATKHLKALQQQGYFIINFGEELNSGDNKGRIFSDKEWIVYEALKEMKSLGFWVCGILLSGLCNDAKPYMELRKMMGGFDGSLILMLDSIVNEQLLMEKIPVLKEVKEINDVVAELVAALDEVKFDAAKELKTKLQVLENLCDVVKSEVDDLFNRVMAQRTKLIDSFRMMKQSQKSVT